MIKLEIVLEEEQIKDVFETEEIKFSKRKYKELLDMIEYADLDIKEILEQALKEQIAEMITDTWER